MYWIRLQYFKRIAAIFTRKPRQLTKRKRRTETQKKLEKLRQIPRRKPARIRRMLINEICSKARNQGKNKGSFSYEENEL